MDYHSVRNTQPLQLYDCSPRVRYLVRRYFVHALLFAYACMPLSIHLLDYSLPVLLQVHSVKLT